MLLLKLAKSFAQQLVKPVCINGGNEVGIRGTIAHAPAIDYGLTRGQLPSSLDGNPGWNRLEQVRREQISNGARVVQEPSWRTVPLAIELTVMG